MLLPFDLLTGSSEALVKVHSGVSKNLELPGMAALSHSCENCTVWCLQPDLAARLALRVNLSTSCCDQEHWCVYLVFYVMAMFA